MSRGRILFDGIYWRGSRRRVGADELFEGSVHGHESARRRVHERVCAVFDVRLHVVRVADGAHLVGRVGRHRAVAVPGGGDRGAHGGVRGDDRVGAPVGARVLDGGRPRVRGRCRDRVHRHAHGFSVRRVRAAERAGPVAGGGRFVLRCGRRADQPVVGAFLGCSICGACTCSCS